MPRFLFQLFYLLLVANVPELVAQSGNQLIRGRLTDEQTKEALPYATLYVPSRKVGIVANAEGRFTLHIAQPTTADTLLISMVGYETRRLPLGSYSTNGTVPMSNNEQTLTLRPAEQRLNEVVVRPVDPVVLVQQAVKRFEQNYPDKPALLTGFYREWVREKTYLVFSEGQLELYKAAYNRKKADAVRMLKGRRKPLPNYFLVGADTCRLPDITNGPHLGILLDVVKNTTMNNFLTTAGSQHYDYTYGGQTTVNDRDAYIIEFAPKLAPIGTLQRIYGLFSGTLLLDVQTLAVVKADFTLSTGGIQNVNMSLATNRLPIVVTRRQYVVTYLPIGDRYRLSHAQVENFYAYLPRRAKPIQNRMDFVVTQVDVDNVQRFSDKNAIQLNQSFSEQVMPFDDSFWANENVIDADK